MAEAFVAGAGLFVLSALVGFPLAVLALRRAALQTGGAVTVALAPAFGLAVWACIGPPLYRYVGPSELWGWPALITLLAAAAAGLAYFVRRGDALGQAPRIDWLVLAGVFLIALACVSAPMVFGGFNRVVFGGNPSDLMTYLTLSETTRTASWEQVRQGYQTTVNPASQALVQENALALYSARFLGANMRLSTFVDLGWFAQVSGIGVGRLVWPFLLALCLAAAAAAWAVCRVLDLPRFWAAAGALAVTLGFWAAMPREGDAYSHLQSVPLTLAIAALRIADARAGRFNIASAALIGVLIAAFVQIYTELAILLLGVLIGEAVAHMLDRNRWITLKSLGVSLACAAAVMLVTGQLSYLVNVTVVQFTTVANASGQLGGFFYSAETLTNPVAAIAGLAWLAEFLGHFGLWPDIANRIAFWLGVFTIALCLIGTLVLLFQQRWRSAAVIAVGAAVGLAAALYGLFVQQQLYIFQKGMAYAAPFALLLIACVGPMLARLQPWNNARFANVQRYASISVSAAARLLLALQLVFAGNAFVRDARGGWPPYLEAAHHGRDYDLAAMRARLEALRPASLLVYIPPSRDWWWAAYTTMAVSRYATYFQMGHFYDNGPVTLIFPALTPAARPEYALIDMSVDYIGERGLGELVLEDRDLRLYRLTGGDADAFAPRPVGPDSVRPAPVSPEAVRPGWADLEHETERQPIVDNATQRPFPASRVTLQPHRRVIAVLPDVPVEAGDTVDVAVRVWSDRPATLTMFVMRHCNQDRGGGDFGTAALVSGPEPQVLQTQVTFSGAFDCVRVDIYNSSEIETARFFLTEPDVRRTRPSQAAPGEQGEIITNYGDSKRSPDR